MLFVFSVFFVVCATVVHFAEMCVACCAQGRVKLTDPCTLRINRWRTEQQRCSLQNFSAYFTFSFWRASPSSFSPHHRDIIRKRFCPPPPIFSLTNLSFIFSHSLTTPWSFMGRRQVEQQLGHRSSGTRCKREEDKRRKKTRTVSDWWVWGVGSRGERWTKEIRRR